MDISLLTAGWMWWTNSWCVFLHWKWKC